MSNLKHILVPTDFSEFSQAAFEYARNLAGPSQAKLHLLHVMKGSRATNGQADQIRTRLERFGTTLDDGDGLSMRTVREVVSGDPPRAITDYAQREQVDLVVMGTHGRTGLAHLTLGSVAERVLRSATCPVLVLGPHGHERQVTLARAAETITEQFGRNHEASLAGGLEDLQAHLEAAFDIPAATCVQILDELQQRGWMSWQDGTPGSWSFLPTTELVETMPASFDTTDEPDSAVLDLIERARKLRATDIHIDPVDQHEILVRLRIDGKLEAYCRLHQTVGEHLVNQVKTLAVLDILEPFTPKEGRLRLPPRLSALEVRITTAPVAAGEAVALRLFARENIFLPLGNLGLSTSSLAAVEGMLRLGEGLVLVTGPTGAGKTTTVYSMIQTLGGAERNVVSIEDPVELAVPFVRQMNVDLKHEVTMTSGLRTILRMDPDVVFIGEIRDSEAADMAMRAANSGKYVLTTLHTRTVSSTITALRDMGIADRSMAGNLTGIINQRLVRRLCSKCREPMDPSAEHQAVFQEAGLSIPSELFAPKGCPDCRKTGYRGRIGVFEVAPIHGEIEAALSRGYGEQGLQELLLSLGLPPLRTDALTKAAAGITSINEALSAHWLT